MKLRPANRILTALLLLLAAFGGNGAGIVVVRFAQTSVTGGEQQRLEPHRAPVPSRHAVPASHPIHRDFSRFDQRPRDLLVRHGLFQRPPPSALLSRS